MSTTQDISYELEYNHTVTEGEIKPVSIEVHFVCSLGKNVNVLRAKFANWMKNPYLLSELLLALQRHSTVNNVIPSCKLRPKFHINFSSDEDGPIAEVVVNLSLLVRDNSKGWLEMAFKDWIECTFNTDLLIYENTISVDINNQ